MPRMGDPMPAFSFENVGARAESSGASLTVPRVSLSPADSCRPSTSKELAPEIFTTLFENRNVQDSVNNKQESSSNSLCVKTTNVVQREPELVEENEEEEEDEPVWRRRESFQDQAEALVKRLGKTTCLKNGMTESVLATPQPASRRGSNVSVSSRRRPSRILDLPPPEDTTSHGSSVLPCHKEEALAFRKLIVVEWQTIATVVDRLLFWIFLIATVAAYLIILLFIPYSKPPFDEDVTPIHVLKGMKRE